MQRSGLLRLLLRLMVLAPLVLLPPAARAGGATLGAAVTPNIIEYEHTPWVRVQNRSTVLADFELSTDAPGWSFDRDALTLAPGERTVIAITSAGKDAGTLNVLVTAHDPVSGQDHGAIALSAVLRHASPWEGVPWVILGIAAVAGVLVACSAVWRRRRGYRAS
jgi:hypothetical protein